jgi:hypothetical protein
MESLVLAPIPSYIITKLELLQKPNAPDSSRVWGVRIVFLVETRESRTLDMAPPVVDALRDLSVALARLADALDEASSISLEL